MPSLTCLFYVKKHAILMPLFHPQLVLTIATTLVVAVSSSSDDDNIIIIIILARPECKVTILWN
jgi:hypothetical protein